MRSAVSYILSSSTSEPKMSHPDYEQYSHDHASMLVLVKQVGQQLKQKTYTKFFERISKLNNIKITDSTGFVRNILVRYVKEYPVENNDWGDFQTHRRLLGIISMGKYDSPAELNEICRQHESYKSKYNSTLFDSRSIFFGPAKETNSLHNDPLSSSSAEIDTKFETISSNVGEVKKVPEANNIEDDVEKFTSPDNFKTRALYYSEMSPCSDLEAQLSEFIHFLFWVLESKRLERSREKLERVSLLVAPFEKRDFVGLDMESRSNKKRCTGRMIKHLGDLCLQAGLVAESLAYYTQAGDILKSVNDWLWLGAAYEGLGVASALVLYPDMQRNVPLQRNASLQEGSPRKPNTASLSTSLTNKKPLAHMLSSDDIMKRYRDAIIHYSKYQYAGIIETEACFKAARIAVEQNHALQAASFLQNVVYINLLLSEQERIQRFETLSDLYMQIGFRRKAAFCLRLAATRYVSPQNPAPNWSKCYELMLQSLLGHNVTLDPVEMRSSNRGWPAIQVQLLQELVLAARRTGHSALATRHMTFLLQTMWPHLSEAERKELSIQLQSLSAQCEGSPVALVLESGLTVPPANLTDIPMCLEFTPQDMPPHLRPRKIEKGKKDTGPFLFTPIHFGGGGSLERKSKKANERLDFLWVKNESCQVLLNLLNPLPFELRVSNMRLLTSGIVFESVPETVTLQPDTPSSIVLSGWSRESGELELTGYSTHTLGVKSNCRLKHMARSKNFPDSYKVDVVPSLPLLEVWTSFPQTLSVSGFLDKNATITASTSLYHGQSGECMVSLKNASDVLIEMLDVEVNSILDPVLQNQIFKLNEEEVKSLLPIAPSETKTLKIHLFSPGNFLTSNVAASPCLPQDLGSGIFSSMSASLPGGSFPLRHNSSFRSSNSGHSSFIGGLTTLFQQQPSTASVEAQFKIRYSGGEGLLTEYCRNCTLLMAIEIMPSIQITNWDVLPAETCSQFYLVLDIANLTSQEMELQYTTTKTILIEGKESCRIPVPVERCPLSKLTDFYQDVIDKNEDERIRINVDVEKICSDHIAECVDIRWHLPSSDARGVASLRGMSFTARMLDLVRMSPIHWEVAINGVVIETQEEVTWEAGNPLHLWMSIANSLERALRQLTLSVQFYQDYENGTLNYRMDTRLAIAGAAKKIIPLVEPNVKVNHQCNVIFFVPGQYKLNIQCCAPENNMAAINPLLSTGHTWRFTPTISIIVT